MPDLILVKLESPGIHLASRAEDAIQHLELGAEWQDTVVSGCGNRRLLETIAPIRNIVRRCEIAHMTDAALFEKSGRDRAEIVALLEGDECPRAKELLKRHWQRSLEFIGSVLGSWPRSRPSRGKPGGSVILPGRLGGGFRNLRLSSSVCQGGPSLGM